MLKIVEEELCIGSLSPKKEAKNYLDVCGEDVKVFANVYGYPNVGDDIIPDNDRLRLFPIKNTGTLAGVAAYFDRIDGDKSGAEFLRDSIIEDPDFGTREDIIHCVACKQHYSEWPVGYMAFHREIYQNDDNSVTYALKPIFYYVPTKYRGRAYSAWLFRGIQEQVLYDLTALISLDAKKYKAVTIFLSVASDFDDEAAEGVYCQTIRGGLELLVDCAALDLDEETLPLDFMFDADLEGPIPGIELRF